MKQETQTETCGGCVWQNHYHSTPPDSGWVRKRIINGSVFYFCAGTSDDYPCDKWMEPENYEEDD